VEQVASNVVPALDRLCRNCGAGAPGAYCPACGQDTRERLPTFAQFMRDATGRYVALDGKLWKTLAALLFRPGFLTREYLAGRRRPIDRAAVLVSAGAVRRAALATESLEIDSLRIRVRRRRRRRGSGREHRHAGRQSTFRLADLPRANGLLSSRSRFNSLTQQKLEQIVRRAAVWPVRVFVLLRRSPCCSSCSISGVGGVRSSPGSGEPRFAAHNHAFLFAVGTLIASFH
jgi:hypothetical protein